MGTQAQMQALLKANPAHRDARTLLGATPLHYAALNADPGPLKACWPPAPTPTRVTAKAARRCTWPPLPPAPNMRGCCCVPAPTRTLKTEAGRDVLSLARKVRADVLVGEISLWILKGCSKDKPC
jgi:hypothetical protein